MILLIALLAVTVTGLLLGCIIPRGRVPYPAKFFLGVHRHVWIDVHLYLALLFLLMILLHIWLNWRWVVPSTRHYFHHRCNNGWWALLAAVLLVAGVCWGAVRA